ncbi:hypothetical protein H8E07_03210 [bacterium]|nr:hypothetical protein [bacterium]
MRNLMKLLAVAAIITLFAGFAVAKTLQPVSKDIIVKDSYIGMDRGLLDCTGQVELTDGVTSFGDNTGMPNNVTTYGCSTWNESGGEVVHHIFFADEVEWSMVINMGGCDLDIAILDQCDEDLGCIGVSDSSVDGTGPGWIGDVYFVVDGYNEAACAFDITVTSTPYIPPEPIGFCDLVQDVDGVGVFTGDTCDGENLITSMDCSAYTENGFEHFYSVFMPAGSSFTVDLIHAIDSALWVLDGCEEPYACLAYADNEWPAGTETITYANPGGDTTVFLVVDSWSSDSCGAYEFMFTPTGGAIANEQLTFGEVKALFQ